MIKRKQLYDEIVAILSVTATEISFKNKCNLLDDNIFLENIIKDILNLCMDWELENLNIEQKNHPGIDLGDKKRHIGVQVTSTKTSSKIISSLDEIIKNHIDQKYCEIYFFILGHKQKSYSVDFDNYSTLDCSANNIWDFEDIAEWCAHYDANKLAKIHALILSELHIPSSEFVIPNELKQELRTFRNYIEEIFSYAKQISLSHNINSAILDIHQKATDILPGLSEYFDEATTNTCKSILDLTYQIGNSIPTDHSLSYTAEIYCDILLRNQHIIHNLAESSFLLSKNLPGLPETINVLIDGNDLFARLSKLKIDTDILYNQFSIANLQNIITKSLFRNVGKSVIIFSKDQPHYNQFLIDRLCSEGTNCTVFDHYDDVKNFIATWAANIPDIIILSTCNEILSQLIASNKDIYLYTVGFLNDIPPQLFPLIFSYSNIETNELLKCFNYQENKRILISELNENTLKIMLANADDNIAHQLRVDYNSEVYISTVTSSLPSETYGVKFRWEAWMPGNGYVGPIAASCSNYIKETLGYIIKGWENGDTGYNDCYAL